MQTLSDPRLWRLVVSVVFLGSVIATPPEIIETAMLVLGILAVGFTFYDLYGADVFRMVKSYLAEGEMADPNIRVETQGGDNATSTEPESTSKTKGSRKAAAA